MESPLPDELVTTFRNDPFAHKIGFELLEVRPGYAKGTVQVKDDVMNFGGVPHGGFLFSIADCVFAAASNSHGRFAVATNVSIQFFAAAKPGEILIVEALETHLGGRTGFYEMWVRTESGDPIARCLGSVHRFDKQVLDHVRT